MSTPASPAEAAAGLLCGTLANIAAGAGAEWTEAHDREVCEAVGLIIAAARIPTGTGAVAQRFIQPGTGGTYELIYIPAGDGWAQVHEDNGTGTGPWQVFHGPTGKATGYITQRRTDLEAGGYVLVSG